MAAYGGPLARAEKKCEEDGEEEGSCCGLIAHLPSPCTAWGHGMGRGVGNDRVKLNRWKRGMED